MPTALFIKKKKDSMCQSRLTRADNLARDGLQELTRIIQRIELSRSP